MSRSALLVPPFLGEGGLDSAAEERSLLRRGRAPRREMTPAAPTDLDGPKICCSTARTESLVSTALLEYGLEASVG